MAERMRWSDNNNWEKNKPNKGYFPAHTQKIHPGQTRSYTLPHNIDIQCGTQSHPLSLSTLNALCAWPRIWVQEPIAVCSDGHDRWQSISLAAQGARGRKCNYPKWAVGRTLGCKQSEDSTIPGKRDEGPQCQTSCSQWELCFAFGLFLGDNACVFCIANCCTPASLFPLVFKRCATVACG